LIRIGIRFYFLGRITQAVTVGILVITGVGVEIVVGAIGNIA